VHRRPPRRLPSWVAAQAEQRLLALLGPAPSGPSGWTPDVPEPAAPPTAPPVAPRLDPGRRGGLALVVVALVVVALVGLQAYRSRPRVAEPPRPPLALSSPGAAGTVVVDVEGAVKRPGVLTLPRGSRVADALRAAGGLRPGTSTAGANLARLLVDGEQLVIGPQPGGGAGAAAGPSATGAQEGGLVDLNAATVEQLDSLPGVGPVLAQRIVDWRTTHGPFRDVAQLREVDGIGERKYAELAARVRV
jgi:competence protein ComEA